jgi:hypothetical protein
MVSQLSIPFEAPKAKVARVLRVPGTARAIERLVVVMVQVEVEKCACDHIGCEPPTDTVLGTPDSSVRSVSDIVAETARVRAALPLDTESVIELPACSQKTWYQGFRQKEDRI